MAVRGRFTFKGRDGSMGYSHGREYQLEVDFGSRIQGTFERIWIYSKNGIPCAYDSMKAFEQNWIRTFKYKRVFSEIDPYGEENWEN